MLFKRRAQPLLLPGLIVEACASSTKFSISCFLSNTSWFCRFSKVYSNKRSMPNHSSQLLENSKNKNNLQKDQSFVTRRISHEYFNIWVPSYIPCLIHALSGSLILFMKLKTKNITSITTTDNKKWIELKRRNFLTLCRVQNYKLNYASAIILALETERKIDDLKNAGSELSVKWGTLAGRSTHRVFQPCNI